MIHLKAFVVVMIVVQFPDSEKCVCVVLAHLRACFVEIGKFYHEKSF